MAFYKKTGFFITIIILLTIVIINYELLSSIIYTKKAESEIEPFNKISYISFLANQNLHKFFKSQAKAANNHTLKIFSVFISNIFSVFIICLIFKTFLQKIMHKALGNGMGPLRSDFRDLRKEEANYLTIILSTILSVKILHSAIFNKKSTIGSVALEIGLVILCYFIIFPFLIFGGYLLFKTLGKNVIIGYYVAWLIFSFYEFSGMEEVDLSKMKKVDFTIFPDVVQTELRNYDLHDKVYEELEFSKDKNAALVGYGVNRRIEIYGKFMEENETGLHAVMLHEIGHAWDNSLLKKILMYITLILVEMFIFILIYTQIAPKFRRNQITRFTAFILLSTIYILFIKNWVFCGFKVVSQNAENEADKFAKKLGYGKELGKVLYDIVIEAKEYLSPTYLYNVFRSTHPPIDLRVNSLGN